MSFARSKFRLTIWWTTRIGKAQSPLPFALHAQRWPSNHAASPNLQGLAPERNDTLVPLILKNKPFSRTVNLLPPEVTLPFAAATQLPASFLGSLLQRFGDRLFKRSIMEEFPTYNPRPDAHSIIDCPDPFSKCRLYYENKELKQPRSAHFSIWIWKQLCKVSFALWKCSSRKKVCEIVFSQSFS